MDKTNIVMKLELPPLHKVCWATGTGSVLEYSQSYSACIPLFFKYTPVFSLHSLW